MRDEPNDDMTRMMLPNAHAIAAHVTPFPDFDAGGDWQIGDGVYQINMDTLARNIDGEVA